MLTPHISITHISITRYTSHYETVMHILCPQDAHLYTFSNRNLENQLKKLKRNKGIRFDPFCTQTPIYAFLNKNIDNWFKTIETIVTCIIINQLCTQTIRNFKQNLSLQVLHALKLLYLSRENITFCTSCPYINIFLECFCLLGLNKVACCED